MVDAIRESYVSRIHMLEIEAERSGKLHRRDLYRAIKHMKGELRQYDMFRKQAEHKKKG